AFTNHHASDVGIRAYNIRHHRRIDHTQPSNAAHAAILINHCHRVALRTHLGGADRMKDRRTVVADESGERRIRVHDLCCKIDHLLEHRREVHVVHQAPGDAYAVRHPAPIFRVVEIIQIDYRRDVRVGAAQTEPSARARALQAGHDCDARHWQVERYSGSETGIEHFKNIHLHVVELVGAGRGIADTDGIGHLRIVRNSRQRRRDHEDHQMVDEIAADPREVDLALDTEGRELLARTNPRAHQESGGVYGARRDRDSATMHLLDRPGALDLDTHGAAIFHDHSTR